MTDSTQAARVHELIDKAKDLITVHQVFGDPIERNGVTIIPAAVVRGAGGGGGGASAADSGEGLGFAVASRPSGTFVIRGDQVEWRPAVDVTRVIQSVAAVLVAYVIFRRRKRPR
jgi:uncharacterized spore protein YtfJ